MSNKVSVFIGVTLLVLICSIAGCVTRSEPKPKQKRVTATPKSVAGTETVNEIIMITREWSPTIPLYEGGPKKTFGCVVLRNDVAYEVEYNDGEEKGGWNDQVPAKKTRSKSWKPIIRDDDHLVRARIRISESTPADIHTAPLHYTIALKK